MDGVTTTTTPTTPARTRRSAVVAACLAVSVASLAGVLGLWAVFVDTEQGQLVDAAAVEGAVYGQTELWRMAERVLDVVSVSAIAVVLVVAVGIAVVRRRWELAVQVALVMGGANLTTQVLKYLVLPRPDHGVNTGSAENTLPSGHTTAATSIAVVLLLVVPARMRPLVAAVGAAYAAATGVSTLVGQWHRPSDVLAAVLVGVRVVPLAGGLLERAARRGRERHQRVEPGVVIRLLQHEPVGRDDLDHPGRTGVFAG